MKYLLIVLIIIIALVGYSIYKNQSPKPKPEEKNAQTQQTNKPKEEIVKPEIEVVSKGINRPHGIAVNNGIIYVSSETDKALYKVKDGNIEKFVSLDFPHDMVFEPDGSIITPVFNEGRVVRINPNGAIETLHSDFKGPNGIAYNKFGAIYVSNYNSGRILTTRDGVNFSEVTAGDIKGPAGIAYDKEKDTIWVAGFLGNTISMYGLGDDKDAAIRRPRTFLATLEGIIHPESIYVKNSKFSIILVTAVKDGKGVIVESNPQGKYKVILETDLPDPMVGYFTEDGYVYLVSPNDPEGRILKAKI